MKHNVRRAAFAKILFDSYYVLPSPPLKKTHIKILFNTFSICLRSWCCRKYAKRKQNRLSFHKYHGANRNSKNSKPRPRIYFLSYSFLSPLSSFTPQLFVSDVPFLSRRIRIHSRMQSHSRSHPLPIRIESHYIVLLRKDTPCQAQDPPSLPSIFYARLCFRRLTGEGIIADLIAQ